MKTAVIFYSFDGNSALVAETIRDSFKADAFEIKTVDAKKRTGFAKFFWGGSQVFFHKKPALLPLEVNVNTYDLIILGTPVWAGSPSPAMVSFLSGTPLSGKKVALFCCHGGGKGKALEKFRALLPGSTIVAETDFENAAKNGRAALKEKIGEWIGSFSS